MNVLIETHHPSHIHFWKYPVRELLSRGHDVRVLGRNRDVMLQLFESYDWMPLIAPSRGSGTGRFPMLGMLQRQAEVVRSIRSFRPVVVASLMGSYTQMAKILGCRNLVFTDSEHQRFNHKIAHPFADEVHTPEAFYLELGSKQRRYHSIHELSFLHTKYFTPCEKTLDAYSLEPGAYVVIRLSAWNTFHDVQQSGIGERIYSFVESHQESGRLLIVAEEGKVPPGLEMLATRIRPEHFHSILAFSRFVLSEGASTSSEASCLGVPTVYINSLPTMGYLQKLSEECEILRCFRDADEGIRQADIWLKQISTADSLDMGERLRFREALCGRHIDLVDYVVRLIESQKQ